LLELRIASGFHSWRWDTVLLDADLLLLVYLLALPVDTHQQESKDYYLVASFAVAVDYVEFHHQEFHPWHFRTDQRHP